MAIAERGAVPAVVDIDLERAEKVAAEISVHSGEVLAFQADVTSRDRAQQVVREVIELTGRVDILVNNAGISQPKSFLDLTEQDWDRTIGIHLKGAFNWSQAVLPSMLHGRWGRIISISSMVAKHGGAYASVSKSCYAAAKAGILGLTHGLAREAAPYVTVNAVCPGVIDTGMASSLTSGEERRRTLGLIPLGRFGQPEDIAQVVAFLASEAAGYITGEEIDVNGGVYID